MIMKINQKLYNKYGDEVIVQRIIGNRYNAILKHIPHYNKEGRVITDAIVEKKVEFDDSDLGIQYFFEKEDIGNRHILYDPDGVYYFNIDNIKRSFKETLESMKDQLPYGPIMFEEEEKQAVVNSFYDEKENQKEAEFITQNTLCFARMDLDTEYSVGYEVKYFDEHFHDKLYISRGTYRRIGDTQIVNWKSKIANLYYAKNVLQRKSEDYVDVGPGECGKAASGFEYNYHVMLRRKFMLNPYDRRDTYVCGVPQIEGSKAEEIQELYKTGEIDAFLLKVLEEKRGENKLTDIIVSIQENQNEMIRHDHKKNMIVQGCAGSGKTMILLHRISYLKYNSLLRSLKRAVMIIPNDQFNIFINDVSIELELEDMPRYTMSQYYLKLIETYQNQIYVDMGEKNKTFLNEIQKLCEKDFLKTNKTSEDELFQKELEYHICEFYDQKFLEYLNEIHANSILEIAKQFNIELLEDKTNVQKLNYLYMYLNKILNILEQATKKEKKALQDAKSYFVNYKTFKRHSQNLVRYLKKLISEFQWPEQSSFYLLLQNICPRKVYEEKIGLLKKEAVELEAKIKSETSGFLRFEINIEDKDRLEELYVQINEMEQQLSEEVLEEGEIPETLVKIMEEIDKLKKWRSDNGYIVRQIYDVLEVYDSILDQIFHEDITFSNILLQLQNLQTMFDDSATTKQIEDKIEKLTSDYENASNKILPLEDRKIINYAHHKLEKRAEIIKDIFEMFVQIKFNQVNNTRHLFILLALYFLHVGKIRINCDFIFVDEAQDYSDIEYRLLRGVHGKNTIIELYGDCMQKITPNRGIDNWNQIQALFGDEYYELKENYRNTVEIANYINNHIKNVFTTIGLHGEKVHKIGKNWNQIVSQELQEHPEERIAVICKDKNIILDDKANFVLKTNVYTVVEAKGLEFDSVYVIDKGMTNNEKYIAYSRALKVLNIVQE